MHEEPLGRNLGSIWRSTVPAASPNFKNSIANRDYSYRGLGFMQNLSNISDPDAVAKVLDGRYITVSVSGETDEMTCSICKQNWLTDGRCEHRFGHEYTDDETELEQLAFWYGGNFVWDEWSWVNGPADPFAMVVNREVAGDAKDSILEIYNYKDATAVQEAVVDSSRRLFKMYALNDSLNKMVQLDDKTSVDSLYKVYGQRLVQVVADLSKSETQIPEKGAKTVADNITPAADAPVVETPAATPAAEPVAAAPAPAAESVVATPPASEPVVEAAPAAPATDGKNAPEATEAAPEVPAVTDSAKPEANKPAAEDPQIKDLTEKHREITEENRTLVQKLADLQSKLRDERIAQLLDLKQSLGLETYASDEERTAASTELQKRSFESIEDQIADLKKAPRRRSKSNLHQSQSLTEQESPVRTELDRIHKAIDSMSPVEIGALLFSGRYMPQVDK
jgi:hypothetical protein